MGFGFLHPLLLFCSLDLNRLTFDLILLFSVTIIFITGGGENRTGHLLKEEGGTDLKM